MNENKIRKVEDTIANNGNLQCSNELLQDNSRKTLFAAAEDAKLTSKLHFEGFQSQSGAATANAASQNANEQLIKARMNQQIQEYMRLLDTGDADAMYQLARCCFNNSIFDEQIRQIADSSTFKAKLNDLARNYACGFAEPDSDQEAFLMFKHAKQQNDPDVLCALGRCYHFGWGVGKDVPKAVEYYVMAADAGSYQAMIELAECKRQNVDEQLRAAFEHFRQLADKGNANAHFAAGVCYYRGIGVAESESMAIDALQTAASCGCTNAMTLLSFPRKIKPNTDGSDALKLCKQAADLRNSQAQYLLAWCYRDGINVTKDVERAVFWAREAAEQGHSAAACMLGYCYDCGTGVEHDEVKVLLYYKQAAIAGDRVAQYNTGKFYYKGVGTAHNFQKAARWLRKSAAREYNNAAELLQECIRKSRKPQVCTWQALTPLSGVQTLFQAAHSFEIAQTPETHNSNEFRRQIAFLLAKLAAAGSQSGAAHKLVGDCYCSGLHVQSDYNAAALNYKRAKPADLAILARLRSCYAAGEADATEIDAFALLQRVNSMLRAEINAVMAQMR